MDEKGNKSEADEDDDGEENDNHMRYQPGFDYTSLFGKYSIHQHIWENQMKNHEQDNDDEKDLMHAVNPVQTTPHGKCDL